MSTPLTPLQIINIAKVSQYLAGDDVAKGSLFGSRLIPTSDRLLYMERKAVEWLYNISPSATAVGAIGGLTMTFIGFNGDKVELFCNIPNVGVVSLGSYLKQSGDTTLTILAASIAAALSYSGFTFSSTTALVNIFAPSSLGASINGGSNLSVVFTPTTTSPIVTLVDVQSITSNSAVGFGNVIAQGGITSFDNSGICISLNPNPTLADTVFSAGSSSGGAYSCPLTGLASGTTYYIVAYTTYNTTTTIYSQQTTFTTL